MEEVVLFLKKQLQRTMTEDYEKVNDSYFDRSVGTDAFEDCRIPPAAHTINPRLRRQILRSRCQRCACAHGILRRV